MRTTLALFVAAVMLGGLARAEAQPRPDPPRVDPQASAPDIDLFAEAYERAGEPTLLVLVGREASTGPRRSQEPVATRAPAPDRYVGGGMNLLDRAGDAAQLRLEIERLLRQRPGVELVSLDALNEQTRREVAMLNLRDESRAVRLISQEINAELVLVIRMLESGQVAERGARYRVSVEVLDVPRGRSIGGFGFDWTRGTDGPTIKAYAEQVTRKFIEQLAHWYVRDGDEGPARRYTVRLTGIEGVEQLVEARNAFEQIDQVQRVRDGGMSSDGLETVASLTIDHIGRPLDLVFGLQQAARDTLDMQIDATDGSSGTITLVARPQPRETSSGQRRLPRWMRLVDPAHPEHEQAKADLAAQYEAEGQPRIGIVINRALSEQEQRHPDYKEQIREIAEQEAERREAEPQQGAGGTYVTVHIGGEDRESEPRDRAAERRRRGPGGRELEDEQQPQEQQLLDTRQMEDSLYKRMLELGLVMVDPSRVRANLRQQMDRARHVFHEDELMYLISQSTELDIVIHGVGRADDEGGVRYTFRAIRVNDGAVLAADSWSSDLPRFGGSSMRRDAMEFAAAYATGSMLDQMLTFWEPPSRISVMVAGASHQRDVFVVMNAFREHVPEVVSVDFDRHETGREGGVGFFNLRYTSSYNDLIREISQQAENLPFDLDVSGTTRDTLNIRLTDTF